MAEISASVGQGGENRSQDVRVVQELLCAHHVPCGRVDGRCGARTISAIMTYQRAFLRNPDGRVDPGGRTMAQLSRIAKPNMVAAGSLTRLMPRPDRKTINCGVSPVTNRIMKERFGEPRSDYSTDCRPVTHPELRKKMSTVNVGPFTVTGMTRAVQSLQEVLGAMQREQREVYTVLGTAGMLCCRFVRGSTKSISNHSWGTAIDLKVDRVLDARGDDKVQYGLTLIAPIFNRFGWYWGAGFTTEDAMHFEAGQALVDSWAGRS